jgi:RHS repeat-associated protein
LTFAAAAREICALTTPSALQLRTANARLTPNICAPNDNKKTVSFYDAAGNMLTAADKVGTITRSYDALNRLATDQNVFGQLLTYSYDAANRLTLRQDSLGGVLTSVYDADNRLTSRQFGGTNQTPLRVDFAYSARSELTTITRYSDLAGSQTVGTSVYTFDADSRLTNLKQTNGSGTSLENYTYTYDAANHVLGEQRNGTPDATYTYDSTDQLLGDGTHTYSYDANGNRTMAGYQTGTGNQLTNDGTWTYTYDNAGNMIQKSKGSGLETWYYGYDNANHMTSVRQTSDGTANQLTVTYTYDVLGNRVQQDKWKSGGSTVTTRFAYHGQNVWADLDGSNTLQVRYLYGDGVDQILGRIVSSGQPNAGVAWYLTDHLGSARDLENGSTQAVGDHLDYDGFGNPTESTTAYGDRYKWTRREYDADTGFQYNRARYYDRLTGRWFALDPLGFSAGDANLYRYVWNRPPNFTDPTGLSPSKPDPRCRILLSLKHELLILKAKLAGLKKMIDLNPVLSDFGKAELLKTLSAPLEKEIAQLEAMINVFPNLPGCSLLP